MRTLRPSNSQSLQPEEINNSFKIVQSITKKYFVETVALVYFFFNSVLLPEGLTFTFLLTPIFYLLLKAKGQKNISFPFVLSFIVAFIVHLIIGVDVVYYLRSWLLIFGTYIFVRAAATWLTQNHPGRIFSLLTTFNIFMVFIALILVVTPFKELMWNTLRITRGVSNFPRLALLTYEASYYSTLLTPLFLYYLNRYFFGDAPRRSIDLLITILFSLALSLSFGVLGGIGIAVLLTMLSKPKLYFKRYRVFYTFAIIAFVLVSIALLLLIVYPDNPIYVRLYNIFTGNDNSAQGRTSEAFHIAYMVAELKSLWFGAGPGQIKTVGRDIILNYYHYNPDEFDALRIPNTVGENFAYFGIVGIIIRFTAIFWLFVKTKVSTNSYRLMLFIFVFIYQFTGSFFTNIAEYLIWALAFINCCPEFDFKTIKANRFKAQD